MNTSRILLLLPSFVFLGSTTLSAQTASTNAVTFVYNAGQPAPATQAVTISGATGSVTARISQNIGIDGAIATAAPDNSGVFADTVTANADGTTTVYIGTNPFYPNILASLAARGGTYTGTLLVSAEGCTDCIAITMNLQIGGGGAVSVFWNGGLATSGVVLNAAPASVGQGVLLLVTSSQATYFVSSSQSWLTVAPANGITGPGSAGSASLTVTAYAMGLAAGTYYANVTISTTLGAVFVPVTFNVGGAAGLTLTPSAMNFQYVWNTQTYSWGQSALLTVTGPTPGAAFSASSSASWLLVNGSTTAAGVVGSAITISVNALALGSPPATNTWSGSVYFYANGLSGTLPVTLAITGAPINYPNALSFYAPTASSAVAAQYVTISGSGSYYTVINRVSGATNWLSVAPASGYLGGSLALAVSVNPSGLAAGVYTGTVQVYLNYGLYIQGISVTLNVAAPSLPTPVFSISTHSLTFNYQQGGSSPPPQTVQANASGSSATYTVSSSNTWITATPASGATPGSISISVDPTGLGVGTQTGTVAVTAPGAVNANHTITVTLNIASAPAISLDTGSLSFVYRLGDPMPAAQSVRVSCTGTALSFQVASPDASWVSVTPSSGTTPASLTFAVNPAGMPAGHHTAAVSITTGGSTKTVSLLLTVMAQLPTITAVYNGASFRQEAIAPGEIITIEGSYLGPDAPSRLSVVNNRASTLLAATRVLVGGMAAALLYADQTQVTAVVPYAIAGKSTTFLQVEREGQKSNALPVAVATTAPGVFTLNASGSGPGAILNQDGSVNSADHPAAAGSVIVVYATGEGQTTPHGSDGLVASELSALPKPVLPVAASIGGLPARVLYAGAAPHSVAGLLQVNVTVPAGASSGELVLTIGGKSSQAGVSVAIK